MQQAQPRFRHPSHGIRGPPPPFTRSFSSKAFELSDRISPPPLQRPTSPQHNMLYAQASRDIQMDKGIQCEREAGIPPRGHTHSNPLLSALLAAANATVNNPQDTIPPPSRRRAQFRTGSLPYWSDSEVNAYDSLDTFTGNQQGQIATVGSAKPYPSATVVAAAATAAAMALAAVQSTSRPQPNKSIEGSLGTPMSRTSLHLDDFSPDATAMRNLTGQFAEASLYARFPADIRTNMDLIAAGEQRKSVNFDTTSLHKQDIYGNLGVEVPQYAPPPPLEKCQQRMNIGSRFCKSTLMSLTLVSIK